MAQTQVQPLLQAPVVEIQIDECPICLEEIVGLKNRVTTDCGHTFHCRCLLNNAAHNGFGCPFCRAELADEVQDSDDDEDEYDSDEDGPARYEDDSDDDDDASRASDYDSEQDDLDGELEYIENQIVKMKEDHVLRGFRWLFQPINIDAVAEETEEEAAEEEEVVVNLDVNLDVNLVVNLDVNLDVNSDSEDTIWETESESSDYEM